MASETSKWLLECEPQVRTQAWQSWATRTEPAMVQKCGPARGMSTDCSERLWTIYGMSSVQFGIVMLINCALGLSTPPVGTTQFVGCAIRLGVGGHGDAHHLAVLWRADLRAGAGHLRALVLDLVPSLFIVVK